MLFYPEDFTLSSWENKNKYTTMEKYSIARLEEETGLRGYLYNFTQMCDITSAKFNSPSAGWTNGQISFMDREV